MSPHTAGSATRQTLRRLLLSAGVLGGLAITALPIASAQAATLAATTPCGTTTLSQPFTPWGDTGYYWLLPGGNFEGSLTGFTLSGGAAKVAGSEPFAATGSLGAWSLSLPAGASLQTPFVCVDGADTYFRFFALNKAASSSVAVSVVYTVAGLQTSFIVGTVTGDSKWTPSAAMHTGGKIASKLSLNGTAQMALRFTAIGGTSQIDDIFIDPRLKH
jgi:hypothetical protein